MQYILQESAGCRHFVGATQGEVLADGQNVAEGLVFVVQSCGESLEVGIFDDSQVLVIAEGEEGFYPVAPSRNGEVVVLYQTGACGLVKPVSVRCRGSAGGIEIFRHVDIVERRIARGVISPVEVVRLGKIKPDAVKFFHNLGYDLQTQRPRLSKWQVLQEKLKVKLYYLKYGRKTLKRLGRLFGFQFLSED